MGVRAFSSQLYDNKATKIPVDFSGTFSYTKLMEIINREFALSKKLSRYFTATPCKRGHIAERYVINGGCVDCVNRKSFTKLDDSFRQPMMKVHLFLSIMKVGQFDKFLLALCQVRHPDVEYRHINRCPLSHIRMCGVIVEREYYIFPEDWNTLDAAMQMFQV